MQLLKEGIPKVKSVQEDVSEIEEIYLDLFQQKEKIIIKEQ